MGLNKKHLDGKILEQVPERAPAYLYVRRDHLTS